MSRKKKLLDFSTMLEFHDRPFKFIQQVWPDIRLYRKQLQVVESVVENDETYVVAGNMLGKDYITSIVVLFFFLTRTPCRIVTTSVNDSHLRVLWGEMGARIDECKYALKHTDGGPLVVNHREIRRITYHLKRDGIPEGELGATCKISYLIGQVSEKGEGMLGHHVADVGDGIPRTMFVADEASGVEDDTERRASTWARRKLVIGNPYPCVNFFFRGVTGGDKEHATDLNLNEG